MKFKHGTRRRALEYEKDWVQRWKADKTFEKSVENRPKDNSFVFYDGPPFISGVPHHGTLLSSIVKDAIPRYQTMKGKRVERVWGWDCHGLPAERYTEKKLGLKSRQEVINYGIEKYIIACRENMVQTSSEWEDVVDRVGRWVDFQGAYKTMDKDYMESVWWAFKTLYEKGKIYEGEKVLMYCTTDATPLSKAEVTMDAGAYQDVTDPSVYVKFKLKPSQDSLKFTPELTKLIKKGEKTSTLRLEPKSLKRGDIAELITRHDTDRVEPFGYAKITNVKTFALKDLPLDYQGHEAYCSKDEQLACYKNYYGDEVTLESVFTVYDFELLDGVQETSTLLAWTTTPWTLPANTALAVNPNLDYVEVEVGDERFILAKELVEKVLVDEKHQPLEYEVVRELRGSELVGRSYEPLFADRNRNPQRLESNLRIITDKDFDENAPDFDESKSWKREAARAVLLNNEGKVALMHARKFGYYKLPGGGIEDGEDCELALKREILEEVGANVIIDDEIGKIEELRSFADNQRQMSYAYKAKVVGETGENNLEEGEKAEDFHVVWADLDEAIRLLESGNFASDRGLEQQFMALRDETLLREYKKLKESAGQNNAHKVWAADYVSSEDGTGIVHLAPAYGEEDFAMAKENKIPVVHTIDENGYFTEGDWVGQNVWEINKQIAKDLKDRGVVWKIDYIRHSYPHCHRCNTRLMYRAHPSWFMDIDGQRTEMLAKNEPINWFPPHVKHGRFEKTVEQAPDWNISRDRFWATAMPVWKSESGKVKVLGSYAELKELSGVELEDYHRPWVDDITFEIDGEKYTRIDKVMDSWFEAGSMPFAQFHYPFDNKEKFETNFPGDFIVEYIGQVRAWFYYMHAMSVALFGENSFKNVIVTGNVAGNDGRKMSKSYGNYTDPNELMDKFSADSLRFLLLSSPLLSGEDFALQDKDVGDVARKLSMIWNMYDFFTMYAEVDGWEYDGKLEDPLESLTNPLDIWIVSRVHQLAAEVERHMDGYNIPDAMSPILPFIDDASNWFVRRSRRRFWRSSNVAAGAEDDGDKNDAYKTLHYVLVRLAYLLAPFTPFLAEELYHNLTGDEESIHLKDWLPTGQINQIVMDDMDTVRDYVNQGLSLRAKAGVKVRQPLQKVTLEGRHLEDYYKEIIQEELNVKNVVFSTTLVVDDSVMNISSSQVELDTDITPELKREGLMREVIRHVQQARKDAGLNVDDRIKIAFTTNEEELAKAIDEFRDNIAQEVLAVDDGGAGPYQHKTDVKVDDYELAISLEKA